MSESGRTTRPVSPHSHSPRHSRICESIVPPFCNSIHTPIPSASFPHEEGEDRSAHLPITAGATTRPPEVPVTPLAGFRFRRMHGFGWGALRIGPLGYTWAAATWTSLVSACAFAHALLRGPVLTPTMAASFTASTAFQGENDEHIHPFANSSPSRVTPGVAARARHAKIGEGSYDKKG